MFNNCIYTFNKCYNSELNTNMVYVHVITYGMLIKGAMSRLPLVS